MRPVRKVDNLTTFLCAVVMKSGNPNFLEPSGPLQACNETALFYFIVKDEVFWNLMLCSPVSTWSCLEIRMQEEITI